jgi:enoyl-CoA hydratase
MAYEALTLNVEDKIAHIQLCRPQLLNRFDMLLHREMLEALREVAAMQDVRATVWSSTGRFFSAGGDTQIMLDAAGDMGNRMALIDEGRALFQAAADFPKPLVVALAGNSYGLGTTLVLAADAIVSCPAVEFSDPHIVMGLVAGDGGAVVWPSSFGMIKAKRHLLTGDPITAAEAHRLGVVTDLVDSVDQVLPAATALAKKIAALPPLAVQMTKRALNKALMARADEVLDLSLYLEGLSFGTEDLLEAVAAFKEKRKGVWKGR